MRKSRLFLPLMLIVSLILTGQAMAFARGAEPVTGQMVICSGHASFIVFTDSDGQPTSPPQLCGDCLHLLAALGPLGPQTAPVDAQTAHLSAVWTPHAGSGLVWRANTARAPPLV